MPQRVVVIYICSLCEEESQDPAANTQIKISYGKTQLSLDACKACLDADPLQSLLEAGQPEKRGPGRPPKPAGPPVPPALLAPAKPGGLARTETGEYRCPDCEHSAATPQGVGMHRRHEHGYVKPDGKKAKALAAVERAS